MFYCLFVALVLLQLRAFGVESEIEGRVDVARHDTGFSVTRARGKFHFTVRSVLVF